MIELQIASRDENYQQASLRHVMCLFEVHIDDVIGEVIASHFEEFHSFSTLHWDHLFLERSVAMIKVGLAVACTSRAKSHIIT